ncbi:MULTISPECIES: IclR family transcriptional regulator [Thermoanaerobacter]|jgi:DNA-binding IclR family transcriptional regulator|uniref:Glycerol operon regulatory protein n=2 Tax=Thermoanaerobacter TaxID=1754 RepID=B0KD83_THEP3|nr:MULTISPECIES: IclR family transcriptional regulator [Thermoanaerobacter]ABY95602.1 transcriptional regulator, IclR family [Thermoanaerobacter pseudethanolicus ATCC 33223]ADV80540.1 Transcriptional regulator IclR [Thermoanaerobacter brockii subsp. finnii Ako-1]MDI3529295.1 IclR family transcriptional regulator, regulon repressor [Thermoanaerobacter sp.]HBW60305.1 IclR family transcriptional regulator [Thermoanaerobacter sp.]
MEKSNITAVQSLERALKILEVLGKNPNGLGVTELAREVDLPKSTVYRLLSTLAKWGYVEQEKENEKYKLGLKIIELSSNILNNLELREVARQYLEELMEFANEVVHLCVLRDGEIVYIDKVESHNTIQMYSQIGKRAPVHCTAVGKAILAFLPQEEAISILKTKGLPRKTPNTITSLEEMLKHLEEIRRLGYAIDNVEHEEGIRCVAAPIFDYTGQVVASVSISGPEYRVTWEKVPGLAVKVKEITKKISQRLGYSG